ncbi:MAG: dipeptide epimerase [Parvularculaceae bacterium]|nr:dipeptide epimerase [Parvularculaceae bacterium]
MTNRSLSVATEHYPLQRAFGISRGTKTAADVVCVTIKSAMGIGRGECVPYARYGESLESVREQIDSVATLIHEGGSRNELLNRLPAGAARNAVDCALWDLEAKETGQTVFDRLGVPQHPVITAFTVPYSDVEDMRQVASDNAHRPLLKIKLGSSNDIDRLEAVAAAAPEAKLIVDANEGWSLSDFEKLVDTFVAANVTLVEQPLAAGQDGDLQAGRYPFQLCADESCHDRKSLEHILGKYDVINIKLDKTGGLTEALVLKTEALEAGLGIMVGCMVGSSLAMAPALVLAHDADVVDLDGPLLLADDIAHGITFEGSSMGTPSPKLWG